MEYIFPTKLHAIAYKRYNHIENSRNDVDFVLCNINENNLEDFVKTYLDSSQFNVNANIRKLWNNLKNEDQASLSGIQEDMLIYLLNMYCCLLNKQKRAQKIRHMVV